jgi:hypothetical protein
VRAEPEEEFVPPPEEEPEPVPPELPPPPIDPPLPLPLEGFADVPFARFAMVFARELMRPASPVELVVVCAAVAAVVFAQSKSANAPSNPAMIHAGFMASFP